MTQQPHIAVLGAGIFVRTQYIPRLREIADTVVVKSIWSRTEVIHLTSARDLLYIGALLCNFSKFISGFIPVHLSK
uniref:Uncharacterized protein n=1 Tax=Nelumbo nucifera TaxID=4432 RepID=A0A822ZCI1_NELNU|nr:TPA_asm: hypothetical protein HUJ06_000473 [Nelumbo nucifera]